MTGTQCYMMPENFELPGTPDMPETPNLPETPESAGITRITGNSRHLTETDSGITR